jgi:signal transduction histidine kinase
VDTDAAKVNANIFGAIKDMIDRNETCINVESKQYTQSGELLDVTISASHFDDHQGKPAGVLFIFRNISAKKRLEEQLLQAQKMEALGTLVAGVAHEINNPINGIINYAQLMVDQEEERNNDGDLPHRIIAEGERIATIVKNLLSVARSSEGERSRDSIRDLLLESLELITPQFRKEGILLTLDLPDNLPDVLVNGQEIQQVFLNILSNAQYALNQKSLEGAGDKRLDITVEKTNTEGIDYIRTTFYDNGTGIQNDVLSKICNPFFSTKPAGQGTGLGLSISHGIIKDHEGKLLFESVENEFTKVMIDLKVHGDTK